MIMIRTNGGRIICITINKSILEGAEEAESTIWLDFWHLRVWLIHEVNLNGWQNDNLIPWNKHCSCQWSERCSLKLQGDCSAAIHQNVKPVDGVWKLIKFSTHAGNHSIVKTVNLISNWKKRRKKSCCRRHSTLLHFFLISFNLFSMKIIARKPKCK